MKTLEAKEAGIKFPMEVERQSLLTETAEHKKDEAEHKALKAVIEADQAEKEPANAES